MIFKWFIGKIFKIYIIILNNYSSRRVNIYILKVAVSKSSNLKITSEKKE